MRAAASKAFVPLTVSFEGGYIGWMFPDLKGLVSTGFGLLLEPVGVAIALPWKRPDGALASREEIVSDFYNVKNHPDAARLGHTSVEKVARLRLDKDGLYQAFQAKLHSNEHVLRAGFPEWDDWSADAQLGVMSQAWAVGPGFYSPSAGRNYFPKLTAALREKDFRTAALECFMPEEKGISGLRPRNVADRILFVNAAIALGTLDPDVLFWPRDLSAEISTEPELPNPPSSEPTRIVDTPIVHPRVPLDGDDE